MKYLALLVCAASLLLAGCAHMNSEHKSACGHQCCMDAKTDCAHCPMCSAKK